MNFDCLRKGTYLQGDSKGTPFKRRVFLAVLLFLLFSLPLYAQGFFSKLSWFGQGTILFFPEDNGVDSDPMPILPSPGFGASYPINDIFKLELTLDFYMTHYDYSDKLGRPVPAAIENRSALVIGSLMGFQAAWHFYINSLITIRAFAGPAADLRIIMLAEDLGPGDTDAQGKTKQIQHYFWSGGRWFMPVVGGGADFTLNSGIKIGVDLRVWIPVYRIWNEEKLPAIEGWRFGPGIRITLN